MKKREIRTQKKKINIVFLKQDKINAQIANISKQIEIHLLREELQHSSTLTTGYPVTD